MCRYFDKSWKSAREVGSRIDSPGCNFLDDNPGKGGGGLPYITDRDAHRKFQK